MIVMIFDDIQLRMIVNTTIISGWWFQSLSKILVSWDDYSQYIEK